MKNPAVGLILGIAVIICALHTFMTQKKKMKTVTPFRLGSLFICGFLVVVIEAARLLGEI